MSGNKTERGGKVAGDYTNIFVPTDPLGNQIDELQERWGLASRTEVVRVGVHLFEQVTNRALAGVADGLFTEEMVEKIERLTNG